MSSVYFDPAVGGDGSTVSDDSNGSTGLASGGHRTRFVPALSQVVSLANFAKGRATASDLSAIAAAESAASAISSPGTNATSGASLNISMGSKSLTIQTGKSLVVGMSVKIASTATPSKWMAGDITDYNSGTGALVVNVLSTLGSGTFADWTISLTGAVSGDPLLKTGGTLSGALVLEADPVVPLGAATKSYVDASNIIRTAYDSRADLRITTPADGAYRLVESLGLFRFYSGNTELDDDETCFATASGRWLLEAVAPDYVYAVLDTEIGDFEYRSAVLEARATTLEALKLTRLSATFNMSLTTLAAITSSDFTVTVAGAEVGDSVIVTPGNSLGTATADKSKLHFVAYVSAANTVIVSIRNASAATAAMTASTWNILIIKK